MGGGNYATPHPFCEHIMYIVVKEKAFQINTPELIKTLSSIYATEGTLDNVRVFHVPESINKLTLMDLIGVKNG